MDIDSPIQVLTLWFVALIFLQIVSGDTTPLLTATSLFAILLVFAIPLYLLMEYVPRMLDR